MTGICVSSCPSTLIVTLRVMGSPAAKRPDRWKAISAGAAMLAIVVGAASWLVLWQAREEAASVERMAYPLPD